MKLILPLIIQVFVMLGDIMLIAASIYLLMTIPIAGIIISAVTFRTWKSQGGFVAWKKENIKSFFRNWERLTS